jgi:glycosyltransferase involved in cell wall biosynthesis
MKKNLFLEKDFAAFICELEAELLKTPGWKDLLFYRGISSLDAGYFDFYMKFLEVLRAEKNIESTSVKTWNQKLNMILRPTASSRTAKFIREKILHSLVMRCPAKSLPKIDARQKALVVRSFNNTSPFPVLQQLAQKPGWQVLFASWNSNLAKPVSKIEIPFLHIERLYRKKYVEINHRHKAIVQKTIACIDPNLPVHILRNQLGVTSQFNASQFLEATITKIRTYTDIYFDLTEKIQPDVLILLNEVSLSERLAGLVAKQMCIPSVCIQHGVYIGYVYRELATDKVIVWGEAPKKFWKKIGCAPERIISVGALAHERWASLKEKNAKTGEGPCILALGQNPAAFISLETHRKTIDAIFRAIQALPQYHFIVKPHPGEDIKPYQAALQELQLPSNVELVTSGAVENAILRSDLVVTVFSTAGLEAMLLGKPVIVLNLSQEPSMAPYVAAAELVESAEILPQAIREIIEDPLRRQSLISAGRQYADAYFGKMDGQSVTRAVQVIKQITEENSP